MNSRRWRFLFMVSMALWVWKLAMLHSLSLRVQRLEEIVQVTKP